MTCYATLADGRNHAGRTITLSTNDDTLLLNNIRLISHRVDRLFASKRPVFAPWIEQREFRFDRTRINSWDYTYRLEDPLLALTAVSVGDNALTLTTQVEAWPTIKAPYPYLRLVNGDTWYSFSTDGIEPFLIKVTGTWGYNSDWANAWLDVTTLSAAVATTTVTSITVTDIDGVDAYGRSPWISAGALLKIDSEYLEVTATNTTTNIATVRRGVNGSTAATHLNAAAVSVYQVEEDLRDVVARQAAFKNSKRGAFETITISDLTTMQFPTDLLQELRAVVAGYALL